MVNKKKLRKVPTKAAVSYEHSSSVQSKSNEQIMLPIQLNMQSTDAIAIKQEEDVKQEPVSIGEMVEVSASTYYNVNHVPVFNEGDVGYDFDYLSLNEVKVEENQECNEKKEENLNKNSDSGENAQNNQEYLQPVQQGEDDFPPPEKSNDTRKQVSNTHGNPQKRHKCEFCEYSTDRKYCIKLHLCKHTGERPHGCHRCPKRFTTQQNLHGHMKVHVKEFLFYCSGCLQEFDEKNEKTAHEMKCKSRRYECHLCRELFGSRKAHIIRHMRVHSGNRPFECVKCFKQFTEKSSLIKHIKLHSGPRSFRCSKCREGFRQQDERDAHQEKCNRHVFECHICGKSCGLKKSHLISHMLSHSGEKPYECKKCPKKYTRKQHKMAHMKTHTKNLQFKCLVCREGFSKDDKRKTHQRNCNGRYYECHLCKMFFHWKMANLKIHMRKHSGEKPFQCELCHITFTQKSSLKKHMKNLHHKNW